MNQGASHDDNNTPPAGPVRWTHRRQLPPGAASPPAPGRTASTSATSSSATTPRTTATPPSSPARPSAPPAIWDKARPRCSPRSASAASTTSTRTPRRRSPSHAPGYIDRDNELIVGLQTDAPLKRAIMPNGGWRMVEDALETYGYEPDPTVRKIFTKYRKTHNDGVFDVYPPDVRAARAVAHHHRPAGRLRPRPDHRRLPPRRAVRRRRADRGQEASSGPRSTCSAVDRGRHPRPRGERRADPRAAASSRRWPPRYGFDISGPAATAQRGRAVAVLRATSAAVKEQNGAAMSLGRTSTFLDVYLQRDLADGPDHRDAGAGADRRLRDQAADRAVPAHPGVRRAVLRRPDLGDRVDRRHGRGRPHRWSPGPRSGSCRRSTTSARRPEPNLTVLWCDRAARRASRSSARRSRSTPRRSSTSPTT